MFLRVSREEIARTICFRTGRCFSTPLIFVQTVTLIRDILLEVAQGAEFSPVRAVHHTRDGLSAGAETLARFLEDALDEVGGA